VTYNIHGGRARGPLAAVIRAVEPDVVVANEAPRMPLVWRLRCSRLARQWDMRRAAGGRDAGQNLICVSSSVEVLSTSTRRLRQPLFQPMRGIVSAQCSLDGAEFGVVGVHLALPDAGRAGQARAAVAAAAQLRGPVIVCGDLNSLPGSPAWQTFDRAGFRDAGASAADLTFSAEEPRKRIDAVLVKGGARVLTCGVPANPPGPYESASDHRPVRAVLELAG
jgi:endonuclease/exonuclease/phosphatase family metal-dependent hydrolase